MIPTQIHQIWLAEGDIPEKQAEWSKQLQSMFSSWTYRLWNEEEIKALITSDYPKLLPLLAGDRTKTSQLGRYAILHKYGGLYIDMDYMVLKPFAHLWPDSAQFVALMYDDLNAFEEMVLG